MTTCILKEDLKKNHTWLKGSGRSHVTNKNLDQRDLHSINRKEKPLKPLTELISPEQKEEGEPSMEPWEHYTSESVTQVLGQTKAEGQWAEVWKWCTGRTEGSNGERAINLSPDRDHCSILSASNRWNTLLYPHGRTLQNSGSEDQSSSHGLIICGRVRLVSEKSANK